MFHWRRVRSSRFARRLDAFLPGKYLHGLRSNRFQLSNLQKHLKIINNKSPSLINNNDQQTDDPEDSNQIDIDSGISRNESTPSFTQRSSNNYIQVDSDNIDKSTPSTSTMKKS